MNLAITLLVVIAVSSVIGTVLKQNEPYQNYIIKFGSFWFEVYKALGLYDVYSAPWFLFIMGFLLVSTSVCVYRNAPSMLRDMKNFRDNVTAKSLQNFHLTATFNAASAPSDVALALQRYFNSHGYRARVKQHDDHVLVAAMKGRANRLGYLFAHVAIVVICIGGLLDGNVPLKLDEARGKVKVETRVLPVSQVPAISRLPAGNASFRGVVNIPEGSTAKFIELRLRDGYLLQELPFAVEVKDFRIEHYPGGQPKSFESDLVIYDPEQDAPLARTISVNHPLLYKGYAVYQANFGDGGSKLTLRAWPLTAQGTAREVRGVVNDSVKLDSPQGPLTLEFSDFKLYNVKPAPPESGKKFRDLGPSFVFKVRNADGIALEYENFMQPVEQNGRLFFISGVRESINEEYSYVHIPADAQGGVERFMRFLAALRDRQILQDAAVQVTQLSLQGGAGENNPKIRKAMADIMQRLLERFGEEGFEGVVSYLRANIPPDRQQAVQTYADLLQEALRIVYGKVLAQEGAAQQDSPQFFEDALNALGVMPQYGAPYYLQLTDFEHVQFSGLQITRAPGKNVVYLGFALLLVGVFIMFYVPHRRLWALASRDAGATRVIFAGSSQRDRLGFAKEFDALRQGLEARFRHDNADAGM